MAKESDGVTICYYLGQATKSSYSGFCATALCLHFQNISTFPSKIGHVRAHKWLKFPIFQASTVHIAGHSTTCSTIAMWLKIHWWISSSASSWISSRQCTDERFRNKRISVDSQTTTTLWTELGRLETAVLHGLLTTSEKNAAVHQRPWKFAPLGHLNVP